MNKNQQSPNFKSPLPKGLLTRATKIIADKKLLQSLIQKASNLKGAAKELKVNFNVLLRLLSAWRTGAYKGVSYGTIILATAALIYFITPLDLIPDFIPISGFIDDTAVLAYVLNKIQQDIEHFKAWEANH